MVPDLPERDPNHPDNHTYKTTVEYAGLPAVFVQHLWQGRLDKVFSREAIGNAELTSPLTAVLIEFATFHRPAEALFRNLKDSQVNHRTLNPPHSNLALTVLNADHRALLSQK